jgi:hypothetical protein
MGRHELRSHRAKGTPDAPPKWAANRLALAPLLMLGSVIAALTIISQMGQSSASSIMITPASPPPVAASLGLPDNGQSPSTPPRAESAAPRAPAHSPTPQSATTAVALLGPPDFDGYCRSTGQGGVRLVSGDAYGWRCVADNGTGDNAQAVCTWTYHAANVTNRVADFNNPSTWQCWRVTRKLGPLDFAAYCRSTGHSGAYNIANRYAYGWYCTDDPRGIDATDACRRLYGVAKPVSRFQNFYDKSSWECWR